MFLPTLGKTVKAFMNCQLSYRMRTAVSSLFFRNRTKKPKQGVMMSRRGYKWSLLSANLESRDKVFLLFGRQRELSLDSCTMQSRQFAAKSSQKETSSRTIELLPVNMSPKLTTAKTERKIRWKRRVRKMPV